MTELTQDQEVLAQRIAAGGRDALVQRLRSAFADAAAAHADLIEIRPERVEALVSQAAERADALQWRQALAVVAARELNLDVTEALDHPAVVRAQGLAGAPSYEERLVALVGRAAPVESAVADQPAAPAQVTAPERATAPDQVAAPGQSEAQAAAATPIPGQKELFTEDHAAPEAVDEPNSVTPDVTAVDDLDATVEHRVTFDDDADAPAPEQPVEEAAEPSPYAVPEALTQAGVPEVSAQPATSEQPALEHEDDHPSVAVTEGELQVSAYHLGGVANLPVSEDDLSLRLSPVGLDILREDVILGRLGWDEIDDIEVPVGRRLLRRDKGKASVTVRTEHGDASFEVPGFSGDELYELFYPLLERYLPTD